MNKVLKNAIKTVFDVQPPVKKDDFLKQLHYPQITYQGFLWNQICYIRKRAWVAAALIVILGWIFAYRLPLFQVLRPDGMKIWSVSALLPFLAMITITEIYRSAAFRMAELERSCRFSLTQIVMARMSILGTLNAAVVLLLLSMISQISTYSLLQTVSYTMVPYLIVCAICLYLLGKMPGSDGIYTCGAVTGFISIMNIICENTAKILYSKAYLNVWLVLFISCILLIGIQIRKLVMGGYYGA